MSIRKNLAILFVAALLFSGSAKESQASAYFKCSVYAHVVRVSKSLKKNRVKLRIKVLKRIHKTPCLVPLFPSSQHNLTLPTSNKLTSQVKVGSIVQIYHYTAYPTPRKGAKMKVSQGWGLTKVLKKKLSDFAKKPSTRPVPPLQKFKSPTTKKAKGKPSSRPASPKKK